MMCATRRTEYNETHRRWAAEHDAQHRTEYDETHARWAREHDAQQSRGTLKPSNKGE